MNTKLKIAIIAFILALGITSKTCAQAADPTAPCGEQYQVVGNGLNPYCQLSAGNGALVNASCAPTGNYFNYLGGVLCVQVVAPSAITNWETHFVVSKSDGTAFTSGGKIIVYITYEGAYRCFPYIAGGTNKVIKLPYSGFAGNNSYEIFIESSTTDKFYGGRYLVSNNVIPCKIFPPNGSMNVSINPSLTFSKLNTNGTNLYRYLARYRKQGASAWNEMSIPTGASFVQLINLNYSSTYDYCIISQWGTSPTRYGESEIFAFTTESSPNPTPLPCYPSTSQNSYEGNWDMTALSVEITGGCTIDPNSLTNLHDSPQIIELGFDDATQTVNLILEPNKTFEYQPVIIRIGTTDGKTTLFEVKQKPMPYSEVTIDFEGLGTTVCSSNFIQIISTNTPLLDNYHVISVYADFIGIGTVEIGRAPAADALANGISCSLPAGTMRFTESRPIRVFLQQANAGGVAVGDYLTETVSSFFFGGNPMPVSSVNLTIQPCANGAAQMTFGSANNGGNFLINIYNSHNEFITQVPQSEYYTTSVTTYRIDLILKVVDLDCNTESEPYTYTITPTPLPVLTLSAANTTIDLGEEIVINFSPSDPVNPYNQPTVAQVSINRGVYVDISIFGNSLKYTPTTAGVHNFQILYSNATGRCWSNVNIDITVNSILATGADIYINSNTGDDANAGTETNPVKTLVKGYSLISDGGGLHFEGIFEELISVDKNISLIGINDPLVKSLIIKAEKTVSVLGNFGITEYLEVESAGTLSCIGNSFILKSDATKTAEGKINGIIHGEIGVERHLTNSNQLRFMGFPVQQSLADLTVVSRPIQELVENAVSTNLAIGFVNTNDSNNIPVKGYRGIWQPLTDKLLFWGTVNNESNYSLVISRTHTGFASQGGYNLLSNPYLTAVDFNAIYNSNLGIGLNAIIYFFSASSPTAGVYRTYNAITGIATNGGKSIIGSSQGFLLRKNTVGLASVSIGKNNRVSGGKSSVFRTENAAKAREKIDLIRIQAKAGADSSEIVLHTWTKATNGIDENLDAFLPQVEESNLIFIKAENTNLLVNAISSFEDAKLPIYFNSSTSREIEISITELSLNVNLIFLDKFMKISTPISELFFYKFKTTDNDAGRFWIIDSKTEKSEMNCLLLYPNPTNHSFRLLLKDTAKFKSVIVYNTLGQLLKSWENIQQQDASFDISNLPAGKYSVEIVFENEPKVIIPLIKE